MMFEMLFFFVLLLVLEYAFYRLGGIGLSVRDQNKSKTRTVLSGAGVITVLGISIYYLSMSSLISVSISATLAIALFVGVWDDFRGVLKWRKVPVLLAAAVSIVMAYLIYGPLWESSILYWDFGAAYWLIIIPAVIAGFANGGNVLGGYDGMEVGVYSVISLLYVAVGYLSGNGTVFYLSLIAFVALSAMLIFNWPPSKLIMGNSGSFATGALLGLIPMVGHFELILPVVFAPHLLEVLLQIKYTRKTRYTVFGSVDESGIIHNKYGKSMSVIHWIISWGNMTEKKISLAMIGIEAVFCVVAFGVWWLWALI